MPGTFPEVTGYRGGGPHGLAPGEWTDDTSMALALADSIAEGGWDLDDQVEHYLKWWTTGRYSVNDRVFDIGVTTVRALQRFQETGSADTRATARSGPAATVRSCGWPRCRSVTTTCSRTAWTT